MECVYEVAAVNTVRKVNITNDMQFEDSDGCLICNIVDGCGCWGAIALFATVSEAESLQHWDMHK